MAVCHHDERQGMDAFTVFPFFFGSEFSVSPNHPLTIFASIFGVLEIVALKTRQKIAPHRGQIVWPGFPPRFPPAFTVFLGDKSCCPELTVFWTQKV